MTKQEAKRFILVVVRSRSHKVFVSDLKAIIMRKKETNRPKVPDFYYRSDKAETLTTTTI